MPILSTISSNSATPGGRSTYFSPSRKTIKAKQALVLSIKELERQLEIKKGLLKEMEESPQKFANGFSINLYHQRLQGDLSQSVCLSKEESLKFSRGDCKKQTHGIHASTWRPTMQPQREFQERPRPIFIGGPSFLFILHFKNYFFLHIV